MKLYETPQTKKRSLYSKQGRSIRSAFFVHSTGASNATLKRYVRCSCYWVQIFMATIGTRRLPQKQSMRLLGLTPTRKSRCAIACPTTLHVGERWQGQTGLTIQSPKRTSSLRFAKITPPPRSGKAPALRRNSDYLQALPCG